MNNAVAEAALSYAGRLTADHDLIAALENTTWIRLGLQMDVLKQPALNDISRSAE